MKEEAEVTKEIIGLKELQETQKAAEVKVKKKKKAPAPQKKWKRMAVLLSKWLGIPLLCVIGLCAGMVIGYVYLGKRPMDDVYDMATWRHIYDLVFSQTS